MMLTDQVRDELARHVTGLQDRPQVMQDKAWWKRNRHILVTPVGPARHRVVLKASNRGKRRWGSCPSTEYEVLQILRHYRGARGELRFPEPICLLEDGSILAMTHLPGRPMSRAILYYVITRWRMDLLLQWSRILGRGIARFQRARGSLVEGTLRNREITERDVRAKAPRVPVLVETGLDRAVNRNSGLLHDTPHSLAHCDLCLQNIVVSRRTVGLVDWEYAGIRSVFHDPLNLGLSMLLAQRRGLSPKTARAMVEVLLRSWLEASQLSFNSGDPRTVAQLEVCRLYCLERYDTTIVNVWPRFASQLIEIVGGL